MHQRRDVSAIQNLLLFTWFCGYKQTKQQEEPESKPFLVGLTDFYNVVLKCRLLESWSLVCETMATRRWYTGEQSWALRECFQRGQ